MKATPSLLLSFACAAVSLSLSAQQPSTPPTWQPHVDAVEPLTGKQKWRVPLTDHQIWSAMLATGGNLLFTGKETGEFDQERARLQDLQR